MTTTTDQTDTSSKPEVQHASHSDFMTFLRQNKERIESWQLPLRRADSENTPSSVK
jgi:hypothetical protein